MTNTIPQTHPEAQDPIRVACVGDGCDPAGGICLRCPGTRIDPGPAAATGIPAASW